LKTEYYHRGRKRKGEAILARVTEGRIYKTLEKKEGGRRFLDRLPKSIRGGGKGGGGDPSFLFTVQGGGGRVKLTHFLLSKGEGGGSVGTFGLFSGKKKKFSCLILPYGEKGGVRVGCLFL